MKNILERIYRRILKEIEKEKDAQENLLLEPDFNDEDLEEEEYLEQSVAADVAGYTLPLGASNFHSTLQQRGDEAGEGFGGARPLKKKKK